MSFKEIIEKLEEKKLILKWLIEGQTIHCLPISSLSYLTKEIIIDLYNVDIKYFK